MTKNVAKNDFKSEKAIWKNLTLFSQLSILVAFIVLIIVMSITIESIRREDRILTQNLEDQAIVMLDALDSTTKNVLYFMDIDEIDSIADSFEDFPNVLVVRIYDSNGRILSASDDSSLESQLDSDPYGSHLAETSALDMSWESDRLVAGRRFTIGSQVLGSARVELSTESLTASIQSSLYRGILSGLLAIFAGVVAVVILSRNITNPIKQLVDTTSRISKGDLETRIDVSGSSSEIDQLAKSIESMRVNLETIYDELEDRIAQRTKELKQSRDEAEASARIANENSRLKSEFLSMMSHELRTPMNAIEGYTGIILQGMAGVEYNDKTEKFVAKVQSNSRRLLGLINDILDLSRIESGRLELAYQPMSLSEVAHNWYDNLSILAKEKGLEFKIKSDPNLPETIYGDAESLSKVAINLLGNAIKFTETGTVSLSLEKRDEQMVIEVTDTGMGIPPHAREFVFEEFRQVDQTSTRRHGGTGLGLAITQKLVRAMGGTIILESEVGVGSTFTVMLPIHTESQSEGVSI